jgi:hypothetical protein
MTPVTIPLWSISCTLILDALMHQKYNNFRSKPAECGLKFEKEKKQSNSKLKQLKFFKEFATA